MRRTLHSLVRLQRLHHATTASVVTWVPPLSLCTTGRGRREGQHSLFLTTKPRRRAQEAEVRASITEHRLPHLGNFENTEKLPHPPPSPQHLA